MAPASLDDTTASTGTDKGSIVLICLIATAILLAIAGGAILRKLRERRLRTEHIRREQEKAAERAQAMGLTGTVDSQWTVDDMPLGLLHGKKRTRNLESTLGDPLHVKLEALVQKEDAKSSRSMSSPMLQLARKGSQSKPAPPTGGVTARRSVSAALLTPKRDTQKTAVGKGSKTSSPKNKLPLAPSAASIASWTRVARALLEPSRTVSTFGGHSPRSQRLSTVMTPSSPNALLMRSELPPPAITISVPTSTSLGAQARAEWEMEMQLQTELDGGEPFEQYVAWGEAHVAPSTFDEHAEHMTEPEERDVVEDMQFAALDVPHHY
ncbi:hypothetical protein EXIGLDRAFT_729856 [Exidia glandulosa HHB12029]|uniref:Uncharacterized protein n=1 Tax=Exidia glandulosa HHB12029 TaxID=1314781 RepID=A0A165LE32_EXIGL|nr:hypothetical protein EXIGLDRAFT_729856 [Exidia glandulosa HHB12029]